MYRVTLTETGDKEYYPNFSSTLIVLGSILGEEETNELFDNIKKRKQLKKFEEGKRGFFRYHGILIERINY